MKGAELPINTLIIIVVGVTVLLAAVAIFFGVFNPVRGGVGLETSKSNACQMLTSLRCQAYTYDIRIDNFDADKDGKFDIGTDNFNPDWSNKGCDTPAADNHKDNLATLCYCYYGISTEKDCKITICGCPEDST